MRELSPCPSCARHVRDAVCPFCGAPSEGARPGPVRSISRRGLTRAAVFAGAALWAGACGGPEIEYEVEDESAGGEVQLESSGFSRAVDDGSGERRDHGDAERAREEEERRRAEQDALERQRRLQLEHEEDRRRQYHQCTPEGICPPYGAPPIDAIA